MGSILGCTEGTFGLGYTYLTNTTEGHCEVVVYNRWTGLVDHWTPFPTKYLDNWLECREC